MEAIAKPRKKRSEQSTLVISYLRFSHPEQMLGDSQRRQLQLSTEWAKENGLKISESLSDLGVSAYRGANSTSGALSDFLRLVEQGRIPRGTILLVEELDRISRQSPEESLHLLFGITRAGISVVTLNTGDVFEHGKIDMGRLMIAVVKFCTAHDESLKKSGRLSEAWKNKRTNAKEKPLTSLIPAWLDFSDGKIIPNPAKGKVVDKIFKLALEGHGATHIAGILNKSAMPILPRSGHYSRKYILYTLNNRAVLGEYRPQRVTYARDDASNRTLRRMVPACEPIKGYYPAIISEADFFAVQHGLSSRRSSTGPTSKFVNLFGGLMFSLKDKSSIVITDKGRGGGKRYTPVSLIERRRDAVEMASCPVRAFEQAVLWRLGEPELFAPVKGNQIRQIQTDLAAIKGQRQAMEKRIADFQDSLLTREGQDTPSVISTLNKWDKRVGELMEAERALKAKAASYSGQGEALTEYFALLERHRKQELTNEQRLELRNVLRRLIERIDCLFKRDGFNYLVGCNAKLRSGSNVEFTFKAEWIDQRKKDNRGHWKAGDVRESLYRVGILNTDGEQTVLVLPDYDRKSQKA